MIRQDNIGGVGRGRRGADGGMVGEGGKVAHEITVPLRGEVLSPTRGRGGRHAGRVRSPVLLILRWGGPALDAAGWLRRWVEHYTNQDYPVTLGVIGRTEEVAAVLVETGVELKSATTNTALTPAVGEALIQTLLAAVPEAEWIGVTRVEEHLDFARAGGLSKVLREAVAEGRTAIPAERWDRVAAGGRLVALPKDGSLAAVYPVATSLSADLTWNPSVTNALWRREIGARASGLFDEKGAVELETNRPEACAPVMLWRYGWDAAARERLAWMMVGEAQDKVQAMKQRWKALVKSGRVSLAATTCWEPDSLLWQEQVKRRRMAAANGRPPAPPEPPPPGQALRMERDFPLRFYINVHSQEQRRFEVRAHFMERGLPGVERFAGIDKQWVRDYRGHWDAGRYALSLTQKRVLREARRREAPAVLMFEDDVVLEEDFLTKAEALLLPQDWGLFYFGCKHLQPPEAIAPGVVRVREAWDLHAFAVRADRYAEVMAVLSPTGRGTRGKVVEPSDRVIARLMSRIPTYAAWPNLAWQRQHPSSLATGWTNDNYDTAGCQRYHLEAVSHLPEAMRELRAAAAPTGRAKTAMQQSWTEALG
jgi:hypothetical protein